MMALPTIGDKKSGANEKTVIPLFEELLKSCSLQLVPRIDTFSKSLHQEHPQRRKDSHHRRRHSGPSDDHSRVLSSPVIEESQLNGTDPFKFKSATSATAQTPRNSIEASPFERHGQYTSRGIGKISHHTDSIPRRSPRKISHRTDSIPRRSPREIHTSGTNNRTHKLARDLRLNCKRKRDTFDEDHGNFSFTVNPIEGSPHKSLTPFLRQKFLNKDLCIKNTNQCTQCGSMLTPEWRSGPLGSGTLCNACGLFFTKLSKRMGVDEAIKRLAKCKMEGNPLDRRCSFGKR